MINSKQMAEYIFHHVTLRIPITNTSIAELHGRKSKALSGQEIKLKKQILTSIGKGSAA